MKGDILKSGYTPASDSFVIKHTKYGTFYGDAWLHPNDEDIDNSFDGCRIAEFRADLQAYKEKAKVLRQRAVGARILVDNLKNSLTPEDFEKASKQVFHLFNDYKKAKTYYLRMKDYEPFFIENLLKKRRDTREMIDARKED